MVAPQRGQAQGPLIHSTLPLVPTGPWAASTSMDRIPRFGCQHSLGAGSPCPPPIMYFQKLKWIIEEALAAHRPISYSALFFETALSDLVGGEERSRAFEPCLNNNYETRLL